MNAPSPQIYIIAGPNGVGKTTYARRFLPAEVQCLEFINADMIAQGLSPFAPERASVRAGRLMLARLDELLAARASFSFETTLSGRGYAALLRAARQAGYRIHLDFLWVPSLAATSSRVAQRVCKGGHDIPIEVQERRFFAGLRNLFSLYRRLGWKPGDFPNAEYAGRNILTLPLFPTMTRADAVRVVDTLGAILQAHRKS